MTLKFDAKYTPKEKIESIPRNWKKLIAIFLLVSSIILVSVFVVSLFYANIGTAFTEVSGDSYFIDNIIELLNRETFGWEVPIAEKGLDFILDVSIYILIFACLGFFSYASVTYLEGSMILESKTWLAELQKQNLIHDFKSFKNLIIQTKTGEITISKNNLKYRIKFPKIEENDLTRFGLVSKEEWITCSCSKKELTSLLYIYLSKVN